MTATAPIKKDIPVRRYHSGAKRRIKAVQGEYYGFEMEVDFPGKGMRGYGVSVPNGNIARSRYQLDAETDGSLSQSGVELITRRPLKVTEIRGKWMSSILARMTDEMGVQRGKQPDNYGLHVNANLEGMTVAEVAAFFTALNFAMSQPAVQLGIMERGHTYQGLEATITRMVNETTSHHGAVAKLTALENRGVLMPYVLPYARQNYAGIRNANSPIAEIRGFHMNTDIEAFKKKAELVQKARRFANNNVELLLNLYVTSLDNGINVFQTMTSAETANLLNLILNTPLNEPLEKKQFTPPNKGVEELARLLTNNFKARATSRYTDHPNCDEDGTLRARTRWRPSV